MTPPRVLLVLATSSGGTGRHVAALARGLRADGWPVRVAGPAETDAEFGFGAAGAEFRPVGISDRPRPALDTAALSRLRRLCAETHVVHAHGLRAGALVVLAARTLRRRRRPGVAVTLHNALVATGRTAAVHGLLLRIVARGADVVLAVSGDLVDQAREAGGRDVSRALVPAPGPTADERPGRQPGRLRAELELPAEAALIVTVARLAPQKGLALLFDALAWLARARPELVLRAVVAGDGPLRPELARDARVRGLPVVLLGPRRDVPDLFVAADVVVSPSVWEGQPLTVQEALRAGAAVVATDVGGTREVTGDGAVLVPPTAVALGAAIAALLDDPGERAALRERALLRAAELPTERDALTQAETLYRRLTPDTLEPRGPADI